MTAFHLDYSQLIGPLIISFFVLNHYGKSVSAVSDKYHTFWPRFLGPSIDQVVLWVPFLLVPYLLARHYDFGIKEIQATVMVTTLLRYVYSIVLHATLGGTLGKLGTKLRVVRASDEQPISWTQAILRDSVPLVLYVALFAVEMWSPEPTINQDGTDYEVIQVVDGMTAVVGWITVGWFLCEMVTMLANEKRRALHDFLAGTVVIRVNLYQGARVPALPDARNAGPTEESPS